MKKIYTSNTKSDSFSRMFSKKMILLLLSAIGIFGGLQAQVTLTATVGAPTGSYTTLKDAFDAINAGTHNGVIVISINASTNEGTTPATLNDGGVDPASYTSVLIQPTADNLTISGAPGGGFGVIQLKGADNVTINGDNPNTAGIHQNLTISNTDGSGSIGGSCIRIATAPTVVSADNNTIKNCILIGNVATGNSSSITATSTSSDISFGIYCGGNGGSTSFDAPTAIVSATGQSAPVGTTIENLLIDNNLISNCGRAIVYNGASNSTANATVISNNTIGTSGAVGAYPHTTPASTVYTKGIWVAGTNGISITRNTINNIISYELDNLAGIELASAIGAGTINIATNTINEVSNNNGGFGAMAVGILVGATGGRFTVSGNIVSGIENSADNATINLAGIRVSTSGGTGDILANKISSVHSWAVAGDGAIGIHLSTAASGCNIVNNFIWDITNIGNFSFGNDFNVNGILLGSGGSHKVYHNSISLYGVNTGTSTNSINCLSIGSSAQSDIDIRNNLFSNTVTGGSASDAHVCLFLPFTATSSMNLTLNNNAYYTGTIAGISGVAFAGGTFYSAANVYDVANFNPLSTAPATNFRSFSSSLGNTNNDIASFGTSAAAPFTSTTDLHIPNGTTTQLESGGAALGIGTDIDGAARSGTFPDIGADEFTGVGVDLTPPLISFTPLASICATGARTLTANITDASGVPTTGIGLPVLYWFINGVAQTPVTGVSIGSGNYTFTFGAAAVFPNVVTYYVVAQDGAGTPNITSNSSVGAGGYTANPPAASTPPTTPDSYSIQTNLAPGTYNVGAAGTYTTLTAAANAYNTSCLTGAITFVLTDATYPSETFPIVFGTLAASATNTLLIKPGAGVAATISGDDPAALIKFSGADYITIDGLNTGGSSLTITNNNTAGTATVLWMASSGANGVTNNAIKNCTFVGSGSTTYGGIIASGSTIVGVASAANSNNTITKCTFQSTQNGIHIRGVAASFDQNWSITNNTFGSLTHRGVGVQNVQNFTISGNIINGLSSLPTVSDTISGIAIFSGSSNGNVFNNKISDIKQNNTIGFGCNGIFLRSDNTAANITIYNNFISDIAGQGFGNTTADDNGYGIMVNNGGGYNIYYNSISLNTDQPKPSGITAAINISPNIVTAGSLDIRNNIFSNTGTIGVNRYSIYSGAANTVYSNINYNDYYFGTAPNLGFISSNRATLAAWQSGTTKDGASISTDPLYISLTDLHLQGLSPLNALANVIPAITTDIDGDTRTVTPDVGADEFPATACSGSNGGTATASSYVICVSGTVTLNCTGFSNGGGIGYQWEFSTNGVSFSNLAGQTNPLTATSGVIAATRYYRLRVTCGASTGYSNVDTINITTPQVLTTTPATRCGTGTVNLGATGSGTMNWYSASTGGTPLYTSTSPSTFTTPVINATTTFFVGSVTNGVTEFGGKLSSTGADGSFLSTVTGIVFDANQSFVLNSTLIYPTGTGTVTIALYNSSNTELASTAAIAVTGSGIGTPVTVPLNFNVPIGTGYFLLLKNYSGISNLIRDITTSYPYPSPSGAINVTGGWNIAASSRYYYFYDLSITTGCESTRSPVIATVTTAPAISPTASPSSICSGQSSTLAVTSPDLNYNFVWSPAGPGVVTPASTTTYTVTATDPGTQCANVATVIVNVSPVPTPVTVSPVNPSICLGSSTTLTASGGLVGGVATANSGTISILIPDVTASGMNTPLSISGVPAGANIDSVIVNFNINFDFFDQDIGVNLEAPNGQIINLLSGTTIGGGTNFTNTSIISDNTKPAISTGAAPFTGLWKADAHTSGFELTPVPAPTTSSWAALYGTPNGTWKFRGWDDEGVGEGTLVEWDLKVYYSYGSTYTWSPATGLNTTSGPVVTANPVSTTTYTITATNPTGCNASPGTSIVTVLNNPLSVSISANPGTTICAGASVTFTATPTNAGPGPFYTWKVNGITVQPGLSATYTTTTLTNGQVVTCDVTPISPLPCSSPATATSNSLTMIVNPIGPVSVSIAAAPGSTICASTSVTFTATPVNGGGAPSYVWKLNGVIVQSGASNTYTNAGLANGNTVLCILTSNASCISGNPATSNTITMTVNPNLPASVVLSAAPGTNVCAGTNVTFTATPTNPGASPTYQFFLNNVSVQNGAGNTYSNAGLSDLDQVYVIMTSNATCVTGSPATSNTITISITGSVPASVTLSPPAGNPIVCGSGTVTLTATPTGGGGAPTYQFFLNTVSVQNSASNTYTYTPATGDQIYVEMTSSLPCASPALSTSNIVTLTVNPIPAAPTISAGGPITFCTGGSVTLTSSYNSAGNLWTPGGATTVSISATISGSYSATYTALGCTSPSSNIIVVTVNPIPAAPTISAGGLTTFCAGGSVTLTSNNPGAGNLWTPGGATTVFISATTTNAYSVTYTALGCTSPSSNIINVTVNALPTAAITGNATLCTGTTNVLNSNGTAGSGSITGYQWYRNAVLIGGATASTYGASLAGTYTVVVTNSNTCTFTSPGFVLSADISALSGVYTISSAAASCTNYQSFALALNDLNTRGISANVIFNVAAGFTETAAPSGLKLGSALLNGNINNPIPLSKSITFQKNGAGANPLISAGVGVSTPASANPDCIFKLVGVDNVTIDAIDINDANASNPATMEFGYGLLKLSTTDGAQSNTIKNCVITLNRLNNATRTVPMFEGSVGILVLNALDGAATTPVTSSGSSAAANSNNKFYSNTIQNCNIGIGLSGYADPTSPFTFGDAGNDIGGGSSATGNTIINFGGGAAAANPAAGVRLLNQWGANVSYNTINNNNGSGVNHIVTLRGIYGEAGLSASATINNNIITIKGGGSTLACTAIDNALGSTALGNTVSINNNVISGIYTTATTGALNGINNTATPATLNMNGNNVQNCSLTGTGIFTAINNGNAAATVNINNDTVQNCTINATGSFFGISNNIPVTSLSMSNNRIAGNSLPGAATGIFNGIINAGSGLGTLTMNSNTITGNSRAMGAGATTMNCLAVASANSAGPLSAIVSNNSITNNTMNAAGATVAVTFNCIFHGGLVSSSYTFSNNYISTNSITGIAAAVAATMSGLSVNGTPTSETISNDTLRNLFITGTSTGLHTIQGIRTNASGGSVRNVNNNIIDSLYCSSGMSAVITGIDSRNGGTVGIFKNKISKLFPGQSATVGSVAKGISITTGTTQNVSNNMISLDMSQAFAPAANTVLSGSDAIRGIELSSATAAQNVNLYYNTIRIAGNGTGASFGSSGISVTSGTPPTVDMRDNLVSNFAVPGGTTPGFTVALRRAAALSAAYSTNSNNNLWYTTETATTPLYFEVATAYATLAAFKAQVTVSREAASIDDLPIFFNSGINDLHLAVGSNCGIDGAGVPVPTYTDDIDAVGVRDPVYPDMGFDEFDGTGGSGTWKGYNTNWMDTRNWCGVLPTAATNVVIPVKSSTFYPIITTTAPVANNVTINSGAASITISATGMLSFKGNFANSGTLTNNGEIVANGTASTQTFPGAVGVIGAMNNLTVNNTSAGDSVILNKNLTITGTLKPTAGKIALNSVDITLRSTAAATARVDILGGTASFGYNGTGKFIVERYILTPRKWQLLSVPTNTVQTIRAAWMEGALNTGSNPVPGYGVQITSMFPTAVALNFDAYTPGGHSMKYFSSALNNYVPVANGLDPIANASGYFLFTRGDRTCTALNGPGTVSPTTLRTTGPLFTGAQSVPVTGNNFASAGNPYASAIDMTTVTFNNIQKIFYLWDPKLAGSSSLGAFQTFTFNSPNFTVFPGGGSYGAANSVSNVVQSGQALFVHSVSGTPGSVDFVENNKTPGSNMVFFTSGQPQSISVFIHSKNADGSTTQLDGAKVDFSDTYSNDVNADDAIKMMNTGENLFIVKGDKELVIERHATITSKDTVYLNLKQVRVMPYLMKLQCSNLDEPGLQAWLIDMYTNTSTPIDLVAGTDYDFSIENIPGSYAADRFKIVFEKTGPLPVTFTNVDAWQQQKDIHVQWKVDNQLNIDRYDVEGSTDGAGFIKLATVAATGINGASVTYNWLDVSVNPGDHYYRIKSLGLGGDMSYSRIVKVKINGGEGSIVVLPNPVINKEIHLQVTNKEAGTYIVQLFNNAGQLVINKQFEHSGGNAIWIIPRNKFIASGSYQIIISDPSGSKNVQKLIVE